MAASSKHQLARLSFAGLSLPALSFIALLTGFTFSLALPASLQAFLPAMESLFLVSLPQLYRSFVSWVTPPCLFVLLNGIIMILTATSGRPVSSDDGCFSELEPSMSMQIENVPYKQGSIDLEPSMSMQIENVPYKQSSIDLEQNFAEPHLVPMLSGGMPAPTMHSCVLPPDCLQDAEKVEMHPSNEVSADGHGDGRQIVSYMKPKEAPLSTAEISPSLEFDADDPSTLSSECNDIVKGVSEPSSPHFPSSPPLKNNIRRSVSIDSASLVENQASSEQLSDEAFRKRIEEFIFRMNTKIRSETRVV